MKVLLHSIQLFLALHHEIKEAAIVTEMLMGFHQLKDPVRSVE